jgi:hypothetical protein
MAKSIIDAAQLGKVTVYNQLGDALQLSEIWQNSTVSLIFILHFG